MFIWLKIIFLQIRGAGAQTKTFSTQETRTFPKTKTFSILNAEDQNFIPSEDQNFYQDWNKISNWYAFW